MSNNFPNDWNINIQPSHKRQTPTFVQLFIINRVLRCTVSKLKNNTRDHTNTHAIRSLLTVFDSEKDKNATFLMITNLCEHGIKTYMNEYCNYNDTTTYIIDQIFNKLILTKFSQDYAAIITYTPIANSCNEHSEYYRTIVFNTKDLMCLIFQFYQYYNKDLKITQDIYNASLVCSHWLYYAFDPNSFYQIQLDRLFCKKSSTDDNPKNTRLWQRFVNVRSLMYTSHSDVYRANKYILSKILLISNNTEKLNMKLRQLKKDRNILKAIMKQCNQSIKEFDVQFWHATSIVKKNQLPPLKLSNVKILHMYNLYFYIIWTNKCQQLYLHKMSTHIDNKWLQFVIDNCDCSGITHWTLDQVNFYGSLGDDNNNNNKDIYGKSTSILFSKFIEKFTNVNKIDICFYENSDYFNKFWEYLNSFVCKNKNNNVYVSLEMIRFDEDDYEELTDIIDEYNFKIDEIKLQLSKWASSVKMQCYFMINIEHLQCVVLHDHDRDYGWQLQKAKGIDSLQIFVKHWNKLIMDHKKQTSNSQLIMKQQNAYEKATVEHSNSNVKVSVSVAENQDPTLRFIHMSSLKLIIISHKLVQSQVLIMNEIIVQLIEIVNQLKSDVCISAEFFIQELVYNEVDQYSLFFQSFEKFCQILAVDVIEQETNTTIPIEIQLTINNTKEFVINELKQIFSTFGEKSILSTKYKQPKCNKCCFPSERPIFESRVTGNGASNVVLFKCANCL